MTEAERPDGIDPEVVAPASAEDSQEVVETEENTSNLGNQLTASRRLVQEGIFQEITPDRFDKLPLEKILLQRIQAITTQINEWTLLRQNTPVIADRDAIDLLLTSLITLRSEMIQASVQKMGDVCYDYPDKPDPALQQSLNGQLLRQDLPLVNFAQDAGQPGLLNESVIPGLRSLDPDGAQIIVDLSTRSEKHFKDNMEQGKRRKESGLGLLNHTNGNGKID